MSGDREKLYVVDSWSCFGSRRRWILAHLWSRHGDVPFPRCARISEWRAAKSPSPPHVPSSSRVGERTLPSLQQCQDCPHSLQLCSRPRFECSIYRRFPSRPACDKSPKFAILSSVSGCFSPRLRIDEDLGTFSPRSTECSSISRLKEIVDRSAMSTNVAACVAPSSFLQADIFSHDTSRG